MFFTHRGLFTPFCFDHARLVMNRHLYGTPCGLPLGISTRTQYARTSYYVPNHIPYLKQSLSTRIIDDELFLRTVHTIDSFDTSDAALQTVIDKGYVCRRLISVALKRPIPWAITNTAVGEGENPSETPCLGTDLHRILRSRPILPGMYNGLLRDHRAEECP